MELIATYSRGEEITATYTVGRGEEIDKLLRWLGERPMLQGRRLAVVAAQREVRTRAFADALSCKIPRTAVGAYSFRGASHETDVKRRHDIVTPIG